MHTQRARLAASLLGMAGLFAATAASAAVLHDEALNGDLSNLAATPTAMGTLALGTSTVAGRLQIIRPEDGSEDALDFFSFVVAAGTQVSAITLNFSQTGYPDGANLSLFAGPDASAPAAALGSLNTRSAGLANGADLLATPAFNLGAPLLAGSYTVDLDGSGPRLGLGSYSVHITVVDPNAQHQVPEPATGLLAAGSLLALAASRRRRT